VGKTSIGWTEETWNPVTGCDRVSPGCDHCYAMTLAARLKLMGSAKYQHDGDPRTSGPGFALTMHPESLDIPLRRRKPTTYFVNSMSDLFHPDVTDEFIGSVFAVMAASEWTFTPRCHTFQVLTKRPQRMAALLGLDDWWQRVDAETIGLLGFRFRRQGDRQPLRAVWLGSSIENDRYAFRANHLRATPAALRFLSLEPLIGGLPSLNLDGIDWVIVGAESGRGARPMDMDWVRPIRDACVERAIPFFLKQDATPGGHKILLPELDGQVWDQMPERSNA
jgi:protein gp37